MPCPRSSRAISVFGAVLLLLVFSRLGAGQTGDATLTGRVVGPEGKPAAGASVRLLQGPGAGGPDTGGVLGQTVADAEGRYRLEYSKPTDDLLGQAPEEFVLVASVAGGERFGTVRLSDSFLDGQEASMDEDIVLDRQLLFGPKIASWQERREGETVTFQRGVVTAWRRLGSGNLQTLYLEITDTGELADPNTEPWRLSGHLVAGGGISVAVPESVTVRYEEAEVLWAEGSGGAQQPPWMAQAFHPLREGVGVPAFEGSGGEAAEAYVKPGDGLKDDHVLTILQGAAGEVPGIGLMIGFIRFLGHVAPPENPAVRVELGGGGPEQLDPNHWDRVEGGWDGPSRSVVLRVPLDVSGVSDTARAVLRASWAEGRASFTHEVPLVASERLPEVENGSEDQETTTAPFTHRQQLSAGGVDPSTLTVEPDAARFAALEDDSVVVRNGKDGTRIAVFLAPGAEASVKELRFSRGVNALAALSDDGQVRAWNIRSGETMAAYPDPWGNVPSTVDAIAWSEQGLLVAAIGASSKEDRDTVRIVNSDGETVASARSSRAGVVSHFVREEFVPGGKYLGLAEHQTFIGGKDNEEAVFLNIANSRILDIAGLKEWHPYFSYSFSHDARRFVFVHPDGRQKRLEVWNLQEQDRLATVSLPEKDVHALVVSRNGRRIAALVEGPELILWELSDGRLLETKTIDSSELLGSSPTLAFSRDGRLLAASISDGGTTVWNAATGSRSGQLPGLTANVAALAFTSGGDRLVVVTEEGQMELYGRQAAGRNDPAGSDAP